MRRVVPQYLLLTALSLFGSTAELAAQSDVAFPSQVYAGRRARLAAEIREAVAIVPGRYLVGEHELPKQDRNFWYLTGVESPYAILLMSAAGNRTALFIPERYQFAGAQYPMVEEPFRRAVWNRPLRRLTPGKEAAEATGIAEVYPIDEFTRRLDDLVGSTRTVYAALDEERRYAPPGLSRPLSLAQQIVASIAQRLPGRKIEDLTPLLARMRLVKDEYEIAALRRAAEISGEGMIEAMKAVRPGMNELEVAGLMEYVWKRLGSPRASFAPIVGSGPHGMVFFTVMGENYNAVDRMMQEGELLFLDYGAAEYQTYAADLCRTLPVSGRFSAEQRKYYDIVLEAQEAAIARVRPGAMMIDAVRASAEVFRRHGLEPFEDVKQMGEDRVWGIMPSPTHYLARGEGIVRYSALGIGVRDLGHHIGLEVSDSRDYSRPMEPGWVFTMEPKIYIPEKQIGIMIEDMVLVTPEGHEVLSARTPKRAEDIERVMRVAQ